MTLPTAPGEVPEIPLPQPGAGELAMDEQQRLASRAPLRQPRFDVEPAVEQLDLVLADGPAVGGRDLGAGEDLVGRCLGHRSLSIDCVLTIRGG